MKKFSNKVHAVYALNFFERRAIQKAFSILCKLLYNLCISAYNFEPWEGKIICIRINGDKILSFDEIEDFVDMMDTMISVNTISCGLESKYDL